jgi:2-polyprenyl-6-methoxyphenol hydroxylase-like FAD-dependent oxidoreductase
MYSNGNAFASNESQSTIAICGAGIGGLTLAAKLAKMGRRTVVFEARDEGTVENEGVFLTLAPNGMNGLRTIGCFDAVRAGGIDTTGIEILNAKGKRLGLADQSDHERAFGAPSVTIGRGALAAILLAAARKAGADVRLGLRVSEVVERPNGVRLGLCDGSWFDSGVVVAADGLRSRVREVVFPEVPSPHFTGLIGTGGMTEVPAGYLPDTGGVMRMTFGANAFFGYMKAADRPVYWFNSYAAGAAEDERRNDPAAYARKIQAMHADDPYPNADILRRVERLERNYPVYDMPRLPSWHRGRVVLMGDAAHAVGPHAGQGASMAIEDALVLDACIDAEQDLSAAFSRYEALRRPRIERVVKLTARNGSRKQSSGRLGLLIRDLALPLLIPLGIRAGRKLFEYRPDLAAGADA